MSDIAIRVDNLSKRYRIGALEPSYRTIRESITRACASPFRRLRALARGESAAAGSETIWALKDVSFEVKRGEVVGIIGRNGAGKSTLLKILARITEPTSGRAVLYGRVGSLLEVGTGFHPELTGRENIYLNGAILGMKRAEIQRKFHDIVAFAEVEQFIDTPVKHYSSGMFLRLAFAVAAHLEPEILVVDEVLAVGDAVFQKRCLGKMGEVARGGRTVLFVSHNMTAVQGMCDLAFWLEEGCMREVGETLKVISQYLTYIDRPATERILQLEPAGPASRSFKLVYASARPENGQPSDPLSTTSPLILEFRYWCGAIPTYTTLNIQLITDLDEIAFTSFPQAKPDQCVAPGKEGFFTTTCRIPEHLLNARRYRVRLRVVRSNNTILDERDLLAFDVNMSARESIHWYGVTQGIVKPLLGWYTRCGSFDAS